MNRLILIGNGFDLAHGLKTSYKDFITNYLYNAINQFFSKEIHEDALINISYKTNFTYPYTNRVKCEFEEIKNTIDTFNNQLVNFSYKSNFFRGLVNKCSNLNWVDIENEYFAALNEYCFEGEFDYKKVKSLNDQFEYLKTLLNQYLEKIDLDGNTGSDNKYARIFYEEFKPEEIVTTTVHNVRPNKVMLINFNYTNSSLRKYLNECRRNIPSTDVVFIHGDLTEPENPIIFGFGDEHNKIYQEFEDHKNNMLFEHIKSFGYFKTKNYHDLVRFTNEDDFQTYIIGHSCGLSDRTMLKHIFEHERCKSIKIFHHQRGNDKNDFTEKTYEIARHFTNKGEMRLKIVPFNKLDCMPQIKAQ